MTGIEEHLVDSLIQDFKRILLKENDFLLGLLIVC
jgi:hypothetical protein